MCLVPDGQQYPYNKLRLAILSQWACHNLMILRKLVCGHSSIDCFKLGTLYHVLVTLHIPCAEAQCIMGRNVDVV